LPIRTASVSTNSSDATDGSLATRAIRAAAPARPRQALLRAPEAPATGLLARHAELVLHLALLAVLRRLLRSTDLRAAKIHFSAVLRADRFRAVTLRLRRAEVIPPVRVSARRNCVRQRHGRGRRHGDDAEDLPN